jgi:hypothetical protein
MHPPPTVQAEVWADYDRSVAAVRAQLGDAAFARTWAEGRAQDLDATMAELSMELRG